MTIANEAAAGCRPGAGRAVPLVAREEADLHVRRTMLQQERLVAAKYAGDAVRTWPYPVIAIVCIAAWFAFWPLAIAGILPLWLGCLATSVFVAGGYVVAHEAMHANLGQPGTPSWFWNQLTGQIATIPMLLPFSMLKEMHLLHHAHCNDPEKDPDAIHAAPTWLGAIYQSWLIRQPGATNTGRRWRRHAEELNNPQARRALAQMIAMQLAGMAFIFAMSWSGHAIVVAMLLWLPRHLGLTYVHAVLSWPTHHPHDRQGRYDNTRIIRHRFGEVLSMGIDYHLIHHLFPNIPFHATGAAYRELKPLLEAQGVDCSAK